MKLISLAKIKSLTELENEFKEINISIINK
jgi:hypothetical protein